MKKVTLASCALALTLLAGGSASADPVGGTQTDHDIARPGYVVQYRFSAYADEVTLVEVTGDGDGDIDCRVFDENGGLVGIDTRPVDGCIISLRPRWTGPFVLKITNEGEVASLYSLRIY